jgi:hypothetical protein
MSVSTLNICREVAEPQSVIGVAIESKSKTGHSAALTDHLLAARRGASETSLRLWSRMAQLTLSTKYVTVEARNPPASARGNIEITDSGLDVWRDSVPVKLRIFIDDVCWRRIAELLVQTNLFKFVVERISFSQIVWIAKLTDEICGS